MKKQIYLCVDLVAHTFKKQLRVAKGTKGVLMMMEENESFEFTEALPTRCNRNPIVWQGKRLNISKDADGTLKVNFKQLKLNDSCNLDVVAKEIRMDLKQARKDLIV